MAAFLAANGQENKELKPEVAKSLLFPGGTERERVTTSVPLSLCSAAVATGCIAPGFHDPMREPGKGGIGGRRGGPLPPHAEVIKWTSYGWELVKEYSRPKFFPLLLEEVSKN